MGHMTFSILLPTDYSALREINRDINDYVVDGQLRSMGAERNHNSEIACL